MNSNTSKEWPDDADGQVLRRLQGKGFDFSRKYLVDFTVDFEEWPPNPEALRAIRREFESAAEYVDDVSGQGSIVVKFESVLDYCFVVDTQLRLSEIVNDFGGWCDSWGVLHST